MALAVAFQHHVIGHAHGADQTHAQAVLRHEGQMDACLPDGLGAFADELHRDGSVGSVILHTGAALGGLQSGDGLQQFLLAVAGDTGDAQDFAAVHIKAGVVQHGDAVGAADGQVLDVQALDRVHGFGALDVQFHFFTHHHGGQGGFVSVPGGNIAHILTLAQDGHAVADGQHLVQFVGNDDNGLAVGFHVADDREEALGLLGGQHGGGLVQDQDVRTAVQHLDDLQRLLLADAHLVDFLVQIQGKLVFFADGAGFFVDLFQVEPAAAHGKGDVFGGGKHIHQFEVLVDHADAQIQRIAGGADGNSLVPHVDLALIGVVDAGDHVHQGRLAAAVFPQQGQDLAPAHAQRDILVSHHRAKGLGDVLQTHGVFGLRHSAGSSHRLFFQSYLKEETFYKTTKREGCGFAAVFPLGYLSAIRQQGQHLR